MRLAEVKVSTRQLPVHANPSPSPSVNTLDSSSGQAKTGPNDVDKHMAFDLWLFQVVELNQLQLVFGRFSGMMAFPKSTFGAQVW